jgi:hypothetical protein
VELFAKSYERRVADVLAYAKSAAEGPPPGP